MLRWLNSVAVRLWKDESGVVLAVTVIVFLTLFVMACGVYAVGETVRERVEIQNAADAAAYSGAIVQADCNSRLAALNRAMSWTYVQMVRMEMDYIVDKWLKLTLDKWEMDNLRMQMFNAPSTCNNGRPYYATGKGYAHEQILLNRSQMVSRQQIKQARQQAAAEGKSYDQLKEPIDKCRDNINEMNAKEVELIEKLPRRVKTTVERILKENIADSWNDQFAGGACLMYALRQEESPLDNNFRILEMGEEDDFLRHSDYRRGAEATFEDGINVWFVKDNGGPGIRRRYEQAASSLIAEWDWRSTLWQLTKAGCILLAQTSGSSNVKGEDGYDSYYITAQCKPRVLKERFFAKGGCILVGVTRRLNNPLQFMAQGGALGIVRPFTLDGGNRFMWTATAAIAGYNPKPPADCQGRYEVTYEDNSGDNLWNLKTSDWDAELLPLHRAWAKGKSRAWTGETAGEILEDVKGGEWVPLYGGGGALGAQGAPKLMNQGAEVSYGGAEGWVVH